jgi:hypothetical protein
MSTRRLCGVLVIVAGVLFAALRFWPLAPAP